ncbi:hypothetical protein B0T18DRAFT_221536 [Schizothecium vesticola]|uniref:Uncharacterized protein n=1 Tax=Schizothecium vesticola TaxID=314040 RepID=A0AA40EKE7_9PEZI|nr:hypothetical protein B0T18DRAFT_221536 [Schizothecium vesticola]
MPRPIPVGAYQGSWAPQPVVHRDGGMEMNHGQLTLRTQSRPIWIDDNGTVLRSEQRPIFVEDDVPRPVDHRSGHAHVQIQDDDDNFVEIVKVTDKFPRRHEPRPMPVDPASRYVERPSAVRQEDMDAFRYHRAPPISHGEMDPYQHQQPSAAPMQYECQENQPPNNQAPPRNDRPVHYERRY